MRRRTYISVSTGLIAGFAGCSGLLGDSGDAGNGGSSRGPVETTEAFYEALLSRDAETANEYVHPEAELPPVSDADAPQNWKDATTVESVTVVERSDDTARVRVVTTFDTITIRSTLEVRRSNDEWLLYDQPPAPGDGAVVPNVQFETEERRADDGQTTAVAFTHTAGEAIDTTTLRATIDGRLIGPADGGKMVPGDVAVVPFTSGGNGFVTKTRVRLVWESPVNDRQEPLVTHRLASRTAGGLGLDIQFDR